MSRFTSSRWFAALVCAMGLALGAAAQEATIRVDVRAPGKPVSPWLTGACIEDVNHEIYGGIYSQMLFGESFQEPPRGEPVKGFVTVEGEWSVKDGEVTGGGGKGPKLISSVPAFANGEIGVDVYLPGEAGDGIHNGGLIVKVSRPGIGADNFDGYEVSIDAGRGVVSLGRHRHDYHLLAEAKADVGPDRWVTLSAKLAERNIEVRVNGKTVIQHEERDRTLAPGTVGLRQWERPAKYRHLWVDTGTGRVDVPMEANPDAAVLVSGMWRPIHTGTAKLAASIVKEQPFVGTQSQRIEHAGGEGEVGVENQGLNRTGLALRAGQRYEGYVWVKGAAGKPVKFVVALESRDGTHKYAEKEVSADDAGDWRRFDFELTPNADDSAARFAVRLKSPGAVILGHAFLQPGEWGRFKGLPVRRDVVEGLIDQGVTVLRYGGSMVNDQEYRWKKMVGPRDRRPPYKGLWYAYSTNGWGIIDFLNLCEAAGFEGIPAFCLDETPQDMADFVEYVNGPSDSEWGRRRVADGHPAPYHLKHVELGNEERVDDVYVGKFKALADAIWGKDPGLVPVVGDFGYHRRITDPMKIEGADSHITSLAGQQAVLEFVKLRGREVWFDVHVWTEGPGVSNDLDALPSFIDAIDKLTDGAKHRVLVFEFNANNHDQRRALGNAIAIGRVERDGRLPIATSANGLQVDGQNDNGWDQGLLFLNPSKVWLQPPGYVTQMISRSRLPLTVPAELTGDGSGLDVTAERSEDGKAVVLRVVNNKDTAVAASVALANFAPSKPAAEVVELAGGLGAANTAERPEAIVPVKREVAVKAGEAVGYTFPPRSFTVIRFE